jgi:phosphoglycolate phosphatase-like HAD superfamily hydrolase
MPISRVVFDIDGTLVDSGGFEETLYTAAVCDVLELHQKNSRSPQGLLALGSVPCPQ